MEHDPKTLNYIKVFLLVVFVAAIVSLSYKTLVSFKNSTFSYGTYNLLIIRQDAYLIHIDVSQKKLQIVKFGNLGKQMVGKTRVYETLKIGMPLDAQIISKQNAGIVINDSFLNFQTLAALLFAHGDYKLDNLDAVDIIKIFFATKGVLSSDRMVTTVNSSQNGYVSENSMNFTDREIFNDGESVEVINATDVDGLGNEFSTALKNLGYNVVSVKSGESGKSSISTDNVNTVSLRRLKTVLAFPVLKKAPGSVSDITITLGKDIVPSLKGL